MSIGDSPYEKVDLPDDGIWHQRIDPEGEFLDQNSVIGPGNYTTSLVDPLPSPGNVQSETSSVITGSQNPSAEELFATKEPIETSDPSDIQRNSASVIGFNKNEPGIQPPSIFVSNDTTDKVFDGSLDDVPETSTKASLPTAQIEMNRNTMHRIHRPHGSLVSNQWSGAHPNLKQRTPNNYDLATQDRQPLVIQGTVDAQTELSAAADVAAFCDDANSVAADVAAARHTNTNMLHVKPRRFSRKRPAFQTPTRISLPLDHLPQSPRVPQAASPSQNVLQSPLYPTPASSSYDLLAHQHLNTACTTGNTTLSQSASPHRSLTGLLSPIDSSPSENTNPVKDITHCPHCPHQGFTGSLANRKNSLRRHIRDNHDSKPRLPCLVPGCTQTIKPGRQDNVLKHVKKVHPDHPLPSSSRKRKRKSDGAPDT